MQDDAELSVETVCNQISCSYEISTPEATSANDAALKHWTHQIRRLDGSDLALLNIRAFKFETVYRRAPGTPSVVRFSSSGTSDLANGKKAILELDAEGLSFYAAAVNRGYQEFLRYIGLDESSVFVSLVPHVIDWPHSSLAHMIHLLSQSGYPVQWSTPEALWAALESIQRRSLSKNVIIFGTSLHHHLVNEQFFCNRTHTKKGVLDLDLVIVDTGGAKGKTVALDSSQLATMLAQSYGSLVRQSPLICSEYGMCELLSQAWSLPGELRKFRCSSTLEALSIDPHTLRELPPGQIGFLGFVDRADPRKPLAILTEDLGYIDESCIQSTFTLIGRSPTSSLKGCSLRLNGWVSSGIPSTELGPMPPKKIPHSNSPLAWADLESKDWLRSYLPSERKAIAEAWRSWTPTPRKHHSHSRRLLIICSANTPITPLFPIFSAWDNGFKDVIIKMPSNRDDDPMANIVRNQISELLDCLNDCFSETNFSVSQALGELGPSLLASVDDVIVFGTDSTVNTLRSLCPRTLNFHGFGDLMNTLEWQIGTPPIELAELCLAWRGRGCLTPRALICSGPKGPSLAEVEDLLDALDQEASLAFQPAQDHLTFYHWHNIHTTQALLVRAGLSPTALSERIYRGRIAVVFDLRGLDAEIVGATLPLEFGGQGFIFLLDPDQLAQLEFTQDISVSCSHPLPTYIDLHNGRNWRALLNDE